MTTSDDRLLGNESDSASNDGGEVTSGHDVAAVTSARLIPAFEPASSLTRTPMRGQFSDACAAWLAKSPSRETRSAYARELRQFFDFAGIPPDHAEQLSTVRPQHVS